MHYLLLAAETVTDKPLPVENWFFIKPFIWLFSQFMNGIMAVLDKGGIYSIPLCIVLFTIVTKMLVLPMTIKQQKSTRLQAVMGPELQAIQKKYQGKTDMASRQKQMEEQQAVQEKYGTSTFSGCLPLLIQMPILFSLYPVIYRMETYVSYLGVLKEKISPEQFTQMWQLFDLNLKNAPKSAEGFPLAWPVLIPLVVAGAQYLQTKLLMSKQAQPNMDNPMMSSMKIMNYTMPLMIGAFAINLPAFLGIYWAVQALVAMVQQIVINKFLDKKSVEELIKESRDKANKKRAKKGLPPISEKANISTRNLGKVKEETEDKAAKEEKVKAATEYYASRSAAPGSLAAKANMVRDYNERNKEGKK